MIKKRFRVVYKDEIKQVNWCGFDIEVDQILHCYDNVNPARHGILMTKHTARDLAKMSGKWTGDLYWVADTDSDHGKYSLTMTDVSLKDMGSGIVWFEHRGYSSLHMLKKTKTRRS